MEPASGPVWPSIVLAIVIMVIAMGLVRCDNADRRAECEAHGGVWIENGIGPPGGCARR